MSSNFQPKSLAVLGRQPQLGLAELESLHGAGHLKPLHDAVLLDIPVADMNFRRLGGTIKLAQVLTILPTTKWQDILDYLTEKIPEHMQYQPAGKFTLGLSTYGLPINLNDQNKGLMAIKRVIRSTGKSVRIIPNKTAELNSAQVLHNKLTTKGAWELLLVRDGQSTILAQTFFVQDIESYTLRDRGRPKRDARVGMLPPKLAQIMINLATGQELGAKSSELRAEASANTKTLLLLDPFCGTGVVLQEALLMDFDVIGTDLDARMAFYSEQNIEWLRQKFPKATGKAQISKGDAQNHKWPKGINAVASETYLGPPIKSLPGSDRLYKMAGEIDVLLKNFLENIKPQLKTGVRLALAVPAWRTKTGFVHLPLLDRLSDMGYNRLDFKRVKNTDLIYFREDQIVAREIIVIEKR